MRGDGKFSIRFDSLNFVSRSQKDAQKCFILSFCVNFRLVQPEFVKDWFLAKGQNFDNISGRCFAILVETPYIKRTGQNKTSKLRQVSLAVDRIEKAF